jgi:Orotate phosphoribosyltransferase
VTREEFFALVNARRGHFVYESGYHSDLWLDLETLCRRPAVVRRYATELARNVSAWRPEVICGPVIEGAFVGLMVATELQCEFAYTVRSADPSRGGLFPVEYQLPAALATTISGRRVVIVNDVISAGSAVRGTLSSLRSAGANVVGVAALAVLGGSFPAYISQQRIPFESLIPIPDNNLWEPANCPLCSASVALEHRATQ